MCLRNLFRLFLCMIFSIFSILGFTTEGKGNSETIDRWHSQISQDRFVYSLLYQLMNKKDVGYYLEIGSGHPKRINNTFVLEKRYDWKGISIDINKDFIEVWRKLRSNPLYIENALKIDYHELLKDFPEEIDYLSLDIDRAYDTVLTKVLETNHKFKIITIEHDFYRYGNKYRDSERSILLSYGYYLLCPDVSNKGKSFEDWWIFPDSFPKEVVEALKSIDLENKHHAEIISKVEYLAHIFEEKNYCDKENKNL